MKDWFKKWCPLLIYFNFIIVCIVILMVIKVLFFPTNIEWFDFNSVIGSLLVGLMALAGVIYTAIVNIDNVSSQIKNSEKQLRFNFNSENKLKALISIKNILSDILSTKQEIPNGKNISNIHKDTRWFEKERPFYLHYLPTEIRGEIEKINKKLKMEDQIYEDYYKDIEILCLAVNEKIEGMSKGIE